MCKNECMICLDEINLQHITKSFDGFSFRDDFMISLKQDCVFIFCCKKMFHAKCLYTWNKKYKNCPHCRKELDITLYIEYYSEEEEDLDDLSENDE